MRDAVALTVLPALWHDLAAEALLDSIADVLWRTFELHFVYLRMRISAPERCREVARGISDVLSIETMRRLSEPARVSGDSLVQRLPVQLEVSGMSVAHWPIRWQNGRVLVAVSGHADVLAAPETRMLLSVVTNYAAAAFQRGAASPPANEGPSNTVVIADRTRRGLAPWQLKRVTAFVGERIAQDIAVEELAALVNLSRFHFCKAFKRATGSTPQQWLTSQRMLRARELLADTDASISLVALSVGYRTPSAFSAVFRREVGRTPSEYRRQKLGGELAS